MLPENGDFEAHWRESRKAARDFRRARLGAFSSRLGRRMRVWISDAPACCENCCESLMCFDEEAASHRRSLGAKKKFQTVELAGIVGSVGRCRAFDGDFLPTCTCSRDRWERVNRAYIEGKHLPPIELYKVGEKYFVYDGNHRVSVARHHGAVTIDALITEFDPP